MYDHPLLLQVNACSLPSRLRQDDSGQLVVLEKQLSSLEGLPFLWCIALTCNISQVSLLAMQALLSLYASLDDKDIPAAFLKWVIDVVLQYLWLAPPVFAPSHCLYCTCGIHSGNAIPVLRNKCNICKLQINVAIMMRRNGLHSGSCPFWLQNLNLIRLATLRICLIG